MRPAIAEWRRGRGVPTDPLQALRASGYLETITAARSGRAAVIASYA